MARPPIASTCLIKISRLQMMLMCKKKNKSSLDGESFYASTLYNEEKLLKIIHVWKVNVALKKVVYYPEKMPSSHQFRNKQLVIVFYSFVLENKTIATITKWFQANKTSEKWIYCFYFAKSLLYTHLFLLPSFSSVLLFLLHHLFSISIICLFYLTFGTIGFCFGDFICFSWFLQFRENKRRQKQ